jgi:murein DD-endopeptidase MepM/ murein hydrolase activator NlpD
LAAHDGVVIYAGRDFRGFGKMVLIEGAYGWASIYAHFSKINVKTGEKVHQGQILGGMGRTGRATGVHLHFELRKKKGPVDPLLYLPASEALVHKQASKPKFGKRASQNDI